MKERGVMAARFRLYLAAFSIGDATKRIIMYDISKEIPFEPHKELLEFEQAAETFGREKMRARNRRDKWKRRKRLLEGSLDVPSRVAPDPLYGISVFRSQDSPAKSWKPP